MVRTMLLACGPFSSVLYLGCDLAARVYPGYGYSGQTISEIGAIGVASRLHTNAERS